MLTAVLVVTSLFNWEPSSIHEWLQPLRPVVEQAVGPVLTEENLRKHNSSVSTTVAQAPEQRTEVMVCWMCSAPPPTVVGNVLNGWDDVMAYCVCADGVV